MEAKTIIIIVLIGSGLGTALFALLALTKRETAGARAFIALMLTITLYSWGYALEIYHADLPGMIFALRIEYLGIALLPAFWLTLAMQYSGFARKLTRPAYALVFVIPAITLVLHYTSAWHTLYYLDLAVNYDAPFPVLSIAKGPWYYVQLVYLNLSTFAGNILYLRMSIRTSGTYRRQALTMLIGSMLPWAGNTIFQMGLSPYGIDLNPIVLAITAPLFTLAMFRFRMFDMVPIARDSVFEGMHEPVLVLDTRNRMVDFNPAAKSLFAGLDNRSIGQDVEVPLREYRAILEQLALESGKEIEVRLRVDGMDRYYNSNIAPVVSPRSKPLGRTIILHEITAQTELRARLLELATIDELTGICNRRHLLNQGMVEMLRAQRYARALSMIMMDLDHFKNVNDTMGHLAGDLVLTHVAAVCKGLLRASDIFGRYGGEEFAVFLPETSPSGAFVIARRLCDSIATEPATAGGKEITVTASFGVAGIDNAGPGDSIESLMQKADRALYLAKERGRNRVEML